MPFCFDLIGDAVASRGSLPAGRRSVRSPNLSSAEKLAGLSELWAEARYGFANFWHVPNLDWDATYLAFIPQVTATTSTADYYRVLQRFYALLQDGHTNVSPPEAIPFGRLPIRTRLIDGHILVVGTRDPEFDSQRIQVGDEVLTINGRPSLPTPPKGSVPTSAPPARRTSTCAPTISSCSAVP